MDRQWHTLTQAAPELAASCEEMMIELAWQAECDRKAGFGWRGTHAMAMRAKAALDKAGVQIDRAVGVINYTEEEEE